MRKALILLLVLVPFCGYSLSVNVEAGVTTAVVQWQSATAGTLWYEIEGGSGWSATSAPESVGNSRHKVTLSGLHSFAKYNLQWTSGVEILDTASFETLQTLFEKSLELAFDHAQNSLINLIIDDVAASNFNSDKKIDIIEALAKAGVKNGGAAFSKSFSNFLRDYLTPAQYLAVEVFLTGDINEKMRQGFYSLNAKLLERMKDSGVLTSGTLQSLKVTFDSE